MIAAAMAAAALLTPAASGPMLPYRRVGVAASEWRLVLSRRTVRTGRLIVELQNRGEDSHDLRLRKIGSRRTWRIPETQPGDIADIEIAARSPGRWRLWCSLEGHRKAGMTATLRVTS